MLSNIYSMYKTPCMEYNNTQRNNNLTNEVKL